MTYSVEELIKLAESMEAGAAVAEALAVKHGKAGDLEEKERQLGRAARGKHFAGVARHFHAVVKRREKQAAFTPPTQAEVIGFAQSDETCQGWPLDDVKSWWRHFESNGWRLKGGAKMKDWRCAAQNGASRWKKEHHQASTPTSRRPAPAAKGKKEDPAGWKDFLRVLNKPYEPHEFATGFLLRDFNSKMRGAR